MAGRVKAVPTRKVEVREYDRRVPVKYNVNSKKKK